MSQFKETMKTRILKIGYFVNTMNRKRERVPVIHFKGYYLFELGFTCGANIEVIPESFGRITIKLVDDATNGRNSAANQAVTN